MEARKGRSILQPGIERTPLNTFVDGHSGYLALGSLPPVEHTGKFTNVSVDVTEVIPLTLTGGKSMITY